MDLKASLYSLNQYFDGAESSQIDFQEIPFFLPINHRASEEIKLVHVLVDPL